MIKKRRHYSKDRKPSFGNTGHKHSEEAKLKMSLAKKGKIVSNETKMRMSLARKGKKLSVEHRKSISLAKKGKPPFIGDKHWNWKGGITNYERKLFLNARRRSLKSNAFGQHTQNEWETLKIQYNFRCPSCKEFEPKIKLTEDHIIPLSKGGSNNIENIQPLCKSCNSQKYTEIIKY